MNKIVTLTGHKYCGKYSVALKLARNTEVAFVKPFTDMHIPIGEKAEKYGDYNYVTKEYLDKLIAEENLLSETIIGDTRYCFFESQMTAPFNVIIVDDEGVLSVLKTWKGKVYTVKVKGKNDEKSDRVGTHLKDDDFNEVFNFGSDDIAELEWRMGYECD